MAAPENDRPGAKKRKLAPSSEKVGTRKPNSDDQGSQNNTIIGPHEAIIAELSSKYKILPASVISSTQIRKRVGQITTHLIDAPAGLPHLVVLFSRPADVGKMITIAEHSKRVLTEEGKTWAQHNQLFEMPPPAEKPLVVEETVLDADGPREDDSESDHFEAMNSRIEQALRPPPPFRALKSMRIFLSLVEVPEIASRDDVTVQTSQKQGS